MAHNFGGFTSPGQWRKGNLHLHSTRSDGAETPEEACAFYRQHGYSFTALTDHMPSRGKGVLPPHPAAELSGPEFLCLRGAEYAIPVHLGVVGPGSEIQPEDAAGISAALRAWWDEGGFCWCAHPYWGNLGTQHLEELEFLPALEIYNNVCEVVWGKGLSAIHWGRTLSVGKRVLAIGVDDSHSVAKHGAGAWVMVKAEELSEQAIIAALRRGDFYSSNGPVIENVYFENAEETRVRVRCSPAWRVRLVSENGHGYTIEASPGEQLTDVVLDWTWTFWGTKSAYLRVEVVDAEGRTAWTQPAYVEE